MPFKSEAQRRLLWAKHPQIAKRWAHEYPNQKKLPMHVDDKEKKSSNVMGVEGFPMPTTIEQKTVRAFEIAGLALDKANQAHAEKKALDVSISQRLPAVINAMATRGMIEENEKEAAAQALSNPLVALDWLQKAAEFKDETEQQPGLGQPVDQAGNSVKNGSHQKRAAMGSEGSPYVGPRTSGKKPSDLAFERGLGLGSM